MTTEFPEMALIDADNGSSNVAHCGGVVLSARLVVTWSRCVAGFSRWIVRAPGVNTTVEGTRGETAEGGSEIGAIRLAKPIQLPRYPTLAESILAEGVGTTSLARGSEVDEVVVRLGRVLKDGKERGRPRDYTSAPFGGTDVGGPVLVDGFEGRWLIAVRGARANDYDTFPRVDLVRPWLKQRVTESEKDVGDFRGPTSVEVRTVTALGAPLPASPSYDLGFSNNPCGGTSLGSWTGAPGTVSGAPNQDSDAGAGDGG